MLQLDPKIAEPVAPDRPELSGPLVNYLDTVRLAAVRAALLTKPQIALRLLLAQLIAGAQHITIKPEPMTPASSEITGALQGLSTIAVMDEARSKALDLLGCDTTNHSLIQGHKPFNADTLRIFSRLLELDTKQVNSILAVLVAETLAIGTGLVDAAGANLDVAVAGGWSPDDTFFALIRDRAVSTAILAEVAPDRPPPSPATTAKEIKSRIRDALKAKPADAPWTTAMDVVPDRRLHRSAADLTAPSRGLTVRKKPAPNDIAAPAIPNQIADLAEPTMTQDDLSTFLRVIPPDDRTWQTFDDNASTTASRDGAAIWRASSQVPSPASSRLCAASTRRTSVLASTLSGNLTDGFGRRTHNITRIAAVVADMDNGLPTSFPLAPTIIVETSPDKFQCWWAIDDGGKFTAAEHRDIHARLVHGYGADPRATGIARVYRVPGFWHLKGEPFLVRVVGGAMRPIDKAALLAAFPPIPSPTPTGAPLRNTPPRAVDFGNSSLDRFTAPLQVIPADNYATWITIGLALHAESGGGSDGLALWDAWSAASAKYWPGECPTRWATFKPSTGNLATGGKIFWLAAQHGWRRSASG